MPIELSDIAAAVANYLNTQVTTTVSAVTPKDENQDVLTPGQDGTFTVTVTNAGPPSGVRLINVVYHVEISDGSVAKLIAPQNAIVAAFDKIDDTTPIPGGTLRGEMFVKRLTDEELTSARPSQFCTSTCIALTRVTRRSALAFSPTPTRAPCSPEAKARTGNRPSRWSDRHGPGGRSGDPRALRVFPERGRIRTSNAASTRQPRKLPALSGPSGAGHANVHRGQSSASQQMTALLEESSHGRTESPSTIQRNEGICAS